MRTLTANTGIRTRHRNTELLAEHQIEANWPVGTPTATTTFRLPFVWLSFAFRLAAGFFRISFWRILLQILLVCAKPGCCLARVPAMLHWSAWAPSADDRMCKQTAWATTALHVRHQRIKSEKILQKPLKINSITSCSVQPKAVCPCSFNNFMRSTFRLPFVCPSFAFRLPFVQVEFRFQ